MDERVLPQVRPPDEAFGALRAQERFVNVVSLLDVRDEDRMLVGLEGAGDALERLDRVVVLLVAVAGEAVGEHDVAEAAVENLLPAGLVADLRDFRWGDVVVVVLERRLHLLQHFLNLRRFRLRLVAALVQLVGIQCDDLLVLLLHWFRLLRNFMNHLGFWNLLGHRINFKDQS